MDSDSETDHELEALNRQVALANIRSQYNTLVAQCKELDGRDTIRQLSIKHVLDEASHAIILASQFDETNQILQTALARIAELESVAHSDSSRHGSETIRLRAELRDAKELLRKNEDLARDAENKVKEVERAIKEEREKVKSEEGKAKKLQEELQEEQQRLKEAQEQLDETGAQLEELKERLKEKGKELDKALKVGGKEGKELSELQEENDILKTELGKSKREKARLQTENSSLSDVSSKANHLLADKISLTHQVSALNTELDSLRQITETSKAHLAEKLELKQQLTTMEFELENCKSIINRLRDSGSTNSANESHLRKELSEARAAINREIKAREKVEKEAAKARDEWEAKEKVMKGKIESGRKAVSESKEAAGNKKDGKRKAGVAQLTMEDLEATVKKPRVKGPQPSVSEFSMTPFFKKVAAAGKFETKMKGAPGDETVLSSSEDEIEVVEDDVYEIIEDTEDEVENTKEGNEEDGEIEAVEPKLRVKPKRGKVPNPTGGATVNLVAAKAAAASTAEDGDDDDNNYLEAAAPTKSTAKNRKVSKPENLIPVAISTTAPTKLLLAGANKRTKKPASTAPAIGDFGVGGWKKGRVPSTASTSTAGPARGKSTVLDEAFEEQLEKVLGKVKPVVAISPPAVVDKGKGKKPEAGGKKKALGALGFGGGLGLTRKTSTLFDDADGSGRLDFDLDRLPVPGGERGGVVQREFSPKKKRPKGLGIRVGVGKKP